MFWKYNLTTASHIGTLLEKENVTLKELMDEEDILQECKAQRQKLIEFLVRPAILHEMVTLITNEPDEELDEKIRYKYPNIACELLTFDVAPIHEALASNEVLLDKLCFFLKSEEQLNPLLSSFFSKTMAKLLSKKTAMIFDYFKSEQDFIPLLLKHIETSAVMDLLSRLMTFTENMEMRAKIVDWLNEQKVVDKLVMLIDPAFSNDIHTNAAHVLCDAIRASREHMSSLQEKADNDPLLEAIESSSNVENLISHMFDNEKKSNVIVNGICVLLSLLEFKKSCSGNSQLVQQQNQTSAHPDSAPQTITSFFLRNDGQDTVTPLDVARLKEGVKNVLAAVSPRLTDFYKFLNNPPSRKPITLTYGVLDPPLGVGRLEVVHLLSTLISTNNHIINVELARLKIILTLMDLFFKYKYNNFLHTHVERCIETILITNEPTVDEEGNKVHPLLDELLVDYKITDKILECFKAQESEDKCGAKDQGYMGHMTKIANHIVQGEESGTNSELIKEKLKEFPEKHQKDWESFINGKLAEINKKNSTPLVGGVPMQPSADAFGFRSVAFSQESSLPQMQQLSSNYVDQFCFNEDFTEAEENVTGQLNRMATVHFRLSEDYLLQRDVELFEQVCKQRNSQMPDDELDSDEDVWDEKEKAFSFRERKESEENSSDSDDTDDANVPISKISPNTVNSDEIKMEVDNQDVGWDSPIENVPMDVTPIALQDPWGTSAQPAPTSDQDNWADFSNFSAFSSGAKCQEGVSSSTLEMETADSNKSGDSGPDVFVNNSEKKEGTTSEKKEDSSKNEIKNGVV